LLTGYKTGSLVTPRRDAFPFFERWIAERFGFLPPLYTFRPADFGSLISCRSDRIKRNGVKPAFPLGEAKDVIINPIFQAKRKRPVLGRLGCESFLGLKKSWATIVQNLGQPIRNPLFDFENRASPQSKLLPIDVLIASVVKPLPRDPSGLIVSAFAGYSLKLGG
jgi:hypothetical protein